MCCQNEQATQCKYSKVCPSNVNDNEKEGSANKCWPANMAMCDGKSIDKDIKKTYATINYSKSE